MKFTQYASLIGAATAANTFCQMKAIKTYSDAECTKDESVADAAVLKATNDSYNGLKDSQGCNKKGDIYA